MIQAPTTLLPAVIAAAREAGAMIATEFALPGGPRLIDHITAPIDVEVELLLRDRLISLLPARFVGEEAGVVTAETNGFCWVVDPHDGTRAYLEGKRGSAVSIALLRAGAPVLAVVYAPLSPDRGPDMIAWAEGGWLTRNGAAVTIDLRDRDLASGDVVFLNHGAWQRPVWNSEACAPAGFLPLPSIAYRLARIAVGDGIATQTLRPVNALDIAAGHALLLAAGGVLLAEDGEPVTYNSLGESRPSACFGGAPAAVTTLLGRRWRGSAEPRREARLTMDWPRIGDTTGFDRAVGCLLGLACGDALGARVEGWDAATIRARFPAGVTTMEPDPVRGTITGQVTDDTELATTLAHALLANDDAARRYADWFASDPLSVGPTTARALGSPNAVPDAASTSNGALMRVAPIGIWARSPAEARDRAARDCRITHPNPVCVAASAALAAAIQAAVAGADMAAIRAAAFGDGPESLTLRRAPSSPVMTSLGIAFDHLARGTPIAEALPAVIGLGGDTDTNAAITGALLGAAQGRAALPPAWVMAVLTCRPDAGLAVARPRPDLYWTDDIIELAEALLIRRLGSAGTERA